MAEYEAYAMGIIMAIEHQVNKLKVFDDSALVIYQLYGEWTTHDAKLIPYHNHVMEMSEHFDKITFQYVLQDKNQTAYTMTTLSSMLLVNKEQEMTIQVQHQTKIAHYQHLDRDDAKADGAYPLGQLKDKRTLRRLVTNFFLSDAILYKRSTDWMLLHCVDEQEAQRIMEEVHEGTFGTHTNGHALARKILRAGYY
ncbi:hypothetical protein CR513_46627, partial [Mucuna pruriens]